MRLVADDFAESEPLGLKDLFAPWLRPSTPDEARFFEHAVISFDTNVLLELYRISAQTRDEMLGLLASVQDRIWIPHQVALEYARNREGKLWEGKKNASEVRTQINNIADQSKTAISTALTAISKFRDRHRTARDWDLKSKGVDVEAISESLQELWKELKEEAVRVRDEIEIPEGLSGDVVLDTLDELFRGRIGEPFDALELEKHVDHALAFRFPNKIPPGYKDGDDKETGLRKAGDYIMWRQLLNHMASLPPNGDRLLIFVTNDFKDDWWASGSGDKTLIPAPELILEMRDEAGAELLMLSSSDFMSGAANYLNSEVSSEAVEELKDHEQREVVYVSEVLKNPDVRTAFVWSQLGLGDEGRKLAEQIKSAMKDSGTLAEQIDQIKSATKSSGTLAEQLNSRNDFAKQARKLAEQTRQSNAFTEEGRTLADQIRKQISPQSWLAADSILGNPGLMKVIRDAQEAADGVPGADRDEDAQEAANGEPDAD